MKIFLLILLAVGALTAAYNIWRGNAATSAEQGAGYWMGAALGVLLAILALAGLALYLLL